jgi:hypothetical protein
VIRVQVGQGKEYRFKRDIDINQMGEVNINELAMSIRELQQIDPHSLLFYFDNTLSLYRLVDLAALQTVHFTALIC